MTKGTRRRTAAAIVCAAVAAGMGASAGHAAKTVQTLGGIEFTPNESLNDTSRFAPGQITVRPNERVTWVDRDRIPEPHTITVVYRREVPDTVNELFNCRACQLINQHLADPNDPNSDIARVRVNVGRPGMNTRGDSLVLGPRGRISALITARVGQVVPYICGIHPWMQGTIRVARRSATAAGGTSGAALTGRPH
jgi:plastocyanin